MGFLYNITPPQQRDYTAGALGNRLASTLTPKVGEIDVIKDFSWTLSQTAPKALEQTPYIRLKEFQMKDNAINQMLKAYNKTIDTSGVVSTFFGAGATALPGSLLRGIENSDLLYENMYDHTSESSTNATGFVYRFPYFENPQNTVNTWTARSSYEQMVQLQKVMAEVQANVIYLNAMAYAHLGPGSYIPPIGSELYLKGLEAGIGGFSGDATGSTTTDVLAAGTVIGKMTHAQSAESSTDRMVLPILGRLRGITKGEFFQQMRQSLVNISVAEVDIMRTIEQLQIAAKSATGNIGQDPVLDKPHIWSSSQPRVFNITFPLYNTNSLTNENAEKLISRNWELCYLLTYQNLYNKKNLFVGFPPVFYEVEVPGVYYTKAAYVSNITILNVGNIRNMFLPVGNSGGTSANYMSVNVPDAYVVNMSIVDYFMPSRNFLDTINDQGLRNTIKRSGT
jgi:hypothetical protein